VNPKKGRRVIGEADRRDERTDRSLENFG